MRIAQVAPLVESVPPRLYGGTERIVSYLTEELVRQGHQVTLFASGDSQTAAELCAAVPRALRLTTPPIRDVSACVALQLERVRQRAAEFDLIHFHTELHHLPLIRALNLDNTLTTLHGRLDLDEYPALFAEFRDLPLVSISNHQRGPLPQCNWAGTVYHGLPSSICGFTSAAQEEYLAFVGRFSPEKRADRAIEIARRAGLRIRIAAKVDPTDRQYFEENIEPLLDQPHVEYVGEICEDDKCDFLGHARALLFPIDWPEPFGLVLIEAMSCGTPCVAWRAGAVPEILEDGMTGYIVDSIDAAAEAVHKAVRLDRSAVRAAFERRFTAERMTRNYVEIYRNLVTRGGRAAA